MVPDKNLKIILIGLVGNMLEWYDFAVYGYFAAIIGTLFFPSSSPSASLLMSFSAFAVGFVSRPIGGAIFGHLGDRLGRKTALVWSTLLMAIPCTLVGLLPTWETIGVAAPVLLVLLRLLQGASVGGELTGSVTYMFERASGGREASTSSWTIVGAISGILLGSAVAAVFTALLSTEQLAAWGWRIPFLLGAVVGIAGYLLRRHMPDEVVSPRDPQRRSPIVIAVRDHWQMMLAGVGLAIMAAINFYMAFVYLTTYMARVAGIDQALSLEINTISMVVLAVAVVAGGRLADRFGARRVLMASAAALFVAAYPLFWLIDHPDPDYALAGQICLAIVVGPYTGVYAFYIGKLFPPEIRMSGFSVSFNISYAIFGGTAPMIAQLLADDVGPHAPALYAMAAAATGMTALAFTMRAGAAENADQGVLKPAVS